MAEGDEDKTSFFTGKGVFCYRKMPFRLKNIWGTYQRLVDKAFSSQIRRNLEAYVDNMGNPLKVKTITDLKPPKTLKEIQSLNGKLAALSWFLSKGADKSLPIFKALKSCTDKKTLQWSTEVEEAFRKMKDFIEIMPTLIAPIKGEVLSTTRSRAKLSRSGKDHISLRSCCKKASKILTDSPHQETPSGKEGEVKAEKSLTKGKARASETNWKLYTDEASSSDGSGAGLMLVSPEGKELMYALRFEFETTNNKAEYEAQLAGLRIAVDMEIKDLDIFVDS
ncbi:reverse transcriptase domain-containing protein [Tanacetum coccineum]